MEPVVGGIVQGLLLETPCSLESDLPSPVIPMGLGNLLYLSEPEIPHLQSWDVTTSHQSCKD